MHSKQWAITAATYYHHQSGAHHAVNDTANDTSVLPTPMRQPPRICVMASYGTLCAASRQALMTSSGNGAP
jgi:hypothetical protein